LLVVFALALGARLAIGLIYNLQGDGLRGFFIYHALARNVLEREGLYFHFYLGLGDRWANRPPLYPLMLAGIRWASNASPVAVLAVQAVLGSLTAVLTAVLAGRFGGRLCGILAGMMAALYPYMVGNDTTLVEQPLYVLFVVAFVLVVLRAHERTADGPAFRLRTAVVAGVLAALASLTRETFNVFIALFALWVLFGWGSLGFFRRLGWLALFSVVFLAVCSPWLIRNMNRFGTPAFSFGAGKSLWVGNNPHTFSHYPERSIDESETEAWTHVPEEMRRRILSHRDNERIQDAIFREMAVDYIREHPGEFAARGARKVAALYSPRLVPASDSRLKETAYTVSYAAVLLLAIGGVLTLGGRWFPVMTVTGLALVSVTAIAFVFWGQTRLRTTYDVFLIVLAAGFLAWLWHRFAPARGDRQARSRPAGPGDRRKTGIP
jgi:4-amino-4-deoxy-L-arabinose transferase-like glycosyltransferase